MSRFLVQSLVIVEEEWISAKLRLQRMKIVREGCQQPPTIFHRNYPYDSWDMGLGLMWRHNSWGIKIHENEIRFCQLANLLVHYIMKYLWKTVDRFLTELQPLTCKSDAIFMNCLCSLNMKNSSSFLVFQSWSWLATALQPQKLKWLLSNNYKKNCKESFLTT